MNMTKYLLFAGMSVLCLRSASAQIDITSQQREVSAYASAPENSASPVSNADLTNTFGAFNEGVNASQTSSATTLSGSLAERMSASTNTRGITRCGLRLPFFRPPKVFALTSRFPFADGDLWE